MQGLRANNLARASARSDFQPACIVRMHAAYLGNVLRIIREQTRQEDARRKPIPARIRWFSARDDRDAVSEFVRTFRFAAPKTLERSPFFQRGYSRTFGLFETKRQGWRAGSGTTKGMSDCHVAFRFAEPTCDRRVSRS